MFDKETIDIISKVAKENRIEPEILLAVTDVESAGVPFWTVGNKKLPPIRFEGHYFYRLIAPDKLSRAIEQGLASKKAGGVKNPNSYSARYTLLNKAKQLDYTAALESTSWGLGQVMGEHWERLGYNSIDEFVTSANTIEGQVQMMLNYIFEFGLLDELRAKNWAAFAKGYNGPSYKKNKYDTKMAAAYKAYTNRVTDIDQSAQIRLMQTMLNAVGGYKLEVDGSMGQKTDTALRDFQLKNGLKVDGIYGPMSRGELEKQYLALQNKKEQAGGLAATGVGTVATALNEAAKQILPLGDVSQIFTWIFVGIILVGVFFTIKGAFTNAR